MNEDQTSPHKAESLGADTAPGSNNAGSPVPHNEAKTANPEGASTAASSDLHKFDELTRENKALEDEKALLASEVAELKDQYLRTRAEFENTRKRLQRDKDEAIQFANKQLLIDVIGIVDDFERATQSSEASRDFDSLFGGINLIEKQFIGMLERKWGIQRFDSVGETFDPQRHEAVAAEPRADLPEQSILEVYQKGYLLHEKVLRSAKVKVSLPA